MGIEGSKCCCESSGDAHEKIDRPSLAYSPGVDDPLRIPPSVASQQDPSKSLVASAKVEMGSPAAQTLAPEPTLAPAPASSPTPTQAISSAPDVKPSPVEAPSSDKLQPGSDEFTITLDRTDGSKLGIDVDHRDGTNLYIDSVSGGLVSEWNKQHPDREVKPGGLILEVNGVCGEVLKMVDECKRRRPLVVRIRPASA